MPHCPKCKYHTLEQRTDQDYILICPNCGAVYYLREIKDEEKDNNRS